jgi:hypothetical protein
MAEAEIVKAGEYLDPISKVLALESTGGITIKTRCRLCNSSYRKQAEEMYESGKGPSDIKKFLDDAGEVIHVSNISHHLRKHYRNIEQVAALIDYSENVRAMMERRRDDLKDVESLVNIGFLELTRVLVLHTGNDMSREKDRNEMIVKLVRSIKESKELLRDMHSEEARIHLVEEKFVKAWAEKISSAKTDDEKKMYIETLQNFRTMLSGMPA